MNNPAFEDQQYVTAAKPARIYDFLLGGKNSYRRDRQAALAVREVASWTRSAALLNRDFGQRSTQVSLNRGIRQFLDLGCGYPAHSLNPEHRDLHELTDRTQPGCPVVYVDHDPFVAAHARALLDTGPPDRVAVVEADILHMPALLANPALCAAFDSTKPVAVSIHDTLAWNPDDTAVAQALRALRDWMPSGSTLSITHLSDHWRSDVVHRAADTYNAHGIAVRPRSRDQVAAHFGDLTHLGPGLTPVGAWHEDSPFAHLPPEHSSAFAGIAVKGEPSRHTPAEELRPLTAEERTVVTYFALGTSLTQLDELHGINRHEARILLHAAQKALGARTARPYELVFRAVAAEQIPAPPPPATAPSAPAFVFLHDLAHGKDTRAMANDDQRSILGLNALGKAVLAELKAKSYPHAVYLQSALLLAVPAADMTAIRKRAASAGTEFP
ncbi:SAM-dependent methyltransferase [Streptomyces sp. NPDC058657]|uniref:SAM-dependent methyltransferase n=1 Tax=unclassified Streptomyces TaxID=2593676 RepID=UPI00366865C3